MRPEVVAAMQVASRKFVKLEDLHEAVGKRIAELLTCPAALVTSGCASALALATAACVAGKDTRRIRQLPDTTGMKNEVIVQQDPPRQLRPRHPQCGRQDGRGRHARAVGEGHQREDRDDVLPQLRRSEGQIHHEEFVAIAKAHKVPR